MLASLARVNQKKKMFEFSHKASSYNYSNVVDGVKNHYFITTPNRQSFTQHFKHLQVCFD